MKLLSVLLMACLLSSLAPKYAVAQAVDWDIAEGRFFTQTGDGGRTGYAITDEDGIPFWSRFEALGGVEVLGYPVSRRYVEDGFVTQAMQRLIFQWHPGEGRVFFVNTMDVLHRGGYDNWLLQDRQTPRPLVLSEEGKPWSEIVESRLALLDERPAIRSKFFSALGDPIALNGLPTSGSVDMGNHYALRTQRLVLQEWKEDVPWARRGQVTVALGGTMTREAGLIPSAALEVEEGPPEMKRERAPAGASFFGSRQVVSLYGYPGAPVLGALGQQGLNATVTRAREMAARVDAQNGALSAVPAFHIIFALAHPSPVPSHLDRTVLEDYLTAAENNGFLVFLDLQIAASRLEDEIAVVLPYLRRPHVHLAIDPEFATPRPGVVIGSLDAATINAAQQQVTDYLEAQGIPGNKIIIVHQFDESMITRKHLLAEYPRVDLVIDADGVGGKAAKIDDYDSYAAHPTREYLGFKVFLEHDAPPMSVGEVLALEPLPNVVIYQ